MISIALQPRTIGLAGFVLVGWMLAGCAVFPVPQEKQVVTVALPLEFNKAHDAVARLVAQRGFAIETSVAHLVSSEWFTIDAQDLDKWGDFGNSTYKMKLLKGVGHISIGLEPASEQGTDANIMVEYRGIWEDNSRGGAYQREAIAYSNGELERTLAEALQSLSLSSSDPAVEKK